MRPPCMPAETVEKVAVTTFSRLRARTLRGFFDKLGPAYMPAPGADFICAGEVNSPGIKVLLRKTLVRAIRRGSVSSGRAGGAL